MTPEELMEIGKKLLKSKNKDYTTNGRYENIERQAEIMSWFKEEVDKAFSSMVAVKLARLGSLLGQGKEPNHESIQDTFVDLINYAALWGGYHSKMLEGKD